MPIFKCFFKIVWKNKTGILIYMAVFAGLSFMISATYAKQGPQLILDMANNGTSVQMAVIDSDNSGFSKALTDHLDIRHDLIELANEPEILQDALFYREVEYILFIPSGAEAKLISGESADLLENVKLPDSMSGIYIDNQIDRYILTVKSYLNAGFEISEAAALASEDLKLGVSVSVYNDQSEIPAESGFYFQYLAYIFVAVIISALGPVLIAFRQKNLTERMRASSLRPKEQNIQLAAGCIIASIGIWLVFIVISITVYGSEMFTAASGLRVLNTFTYIFVCVSIAFLCGIFMKTTDAMAAVTNAVSLGMSFLCGAFVPQNLLGEKVLSVAKFFPAYWYIKNNDMLLYVTKLSGENLNIFTQGIIIQIGFAAAIFAAALLLGKQNKAS